MKNIKWKLYGLKLLSFLLGIITLGIPTLVKIINESIKELEEKINKEIEKEENGK